MVIQSKKVWLADQFVPAAIEVNDGRITAILPYGTKDVDDDYGDKRIVPGFMDIHCHGAYEFDTNDANEDGLRYWAEHIVSEGVTSFLATTITQSVEVLTNAVTNVANVMESGYDGAEILGIHFEGPYLDMKYKGAQPDQYIVKPTIEQFEHYQKAARGHIRYVKLATELSRRGTGKTIYVLDEPTTGLHFADVHKLVEILRRLSEGGNTVVVIEHNLDVIKTADYIIDMGPEGGDRGGTVIAKGTPEQVAESPVSYTGRYVKKYLEKREEV